VGGEPVDGGVDEPQHGRVLLDKQIDSSTEKASRRAARVESSLEHVATSSTLAASENSLLLTCAWWQPPKGIPSVPPPLTAAMRVDPSQASLHHARGAASDCGAMCVDPSHERASTTPAELPEAAHVSGSAREKRGTAPP
jgi:hypothetical protein